MNENLDRIERRLNSEYCDTLASKRFSEDQKSTMAARIASKAASTSTQSIFEENAAVFAHPGKRRQTHTKIDTSSPLKRLFRNPASIAAIVAICLVIPLPAVAATSGLQGRFVDIFRFDGAIVGTKHEDATTKILVSTIVEGGSLSVTATFANPQEAPYAYTERLGISSYQILGSNEETIAEGEIESVIIVNGTATISIPVEGLESGTYKLIISSFLSEKKADQPLEIHGTWKCSFTL